MLGLSSHGRAGEAFTIRNAPMLSRKNTAIRDGGLSVRVQRRILNARAFRVNSRRCGPIKATLPRKRYKQHEKRDHPNEVSEAIWRGFVVAGTRCHFLAIIALDR